MLFLCVNCYLHELKGLDSNFQDCWRHRPLQEHTRISQSTNAEKLCQKQMEGERDPHKQKKHTTFLQGSVFAYTPVCLHPVSTASLQRDCCHPPHEAPAAGHQLWQQHSQHGLSVQPSEPSSSQEPVCGLCPAFPEGL